MDRDFVEINIDGMIGPSHHFGGLGVENKASESNRAQTSSPRNAALQGLDKMELVASHGSPQFYLPPPSRPAWGWLESLGYVGNKKQILADCYRDHPTVLSSAYSSAFMWTANAASVACGSDTQTGSCVIKVANLNANLHRSIEAAERFSQLRYMFAGVDRVRVLNGLFSSRPLCDEGAANIMRFCGSNGGSGIYALVYGEEFGSAVDRGLALYQDDQPTGKHAKRRQPRQTRLASELMAKALGLRSADYFLLQQTNEAIDAGVFHNDVIATSHENLLLYHESAFVKSEEAIARVRGRFLEKTGSTLHVMRVESSELSLDQAVDSYLFNSQICTDSRGGWRMFVPDNCGESPAVECVLERVRREVPRLSSIDYCPLGESMKNGGGPACLRLRVSLTPNQINSLPRAMRITSCTLPSLRKLVETEYPEKVEPSDFENPDFAAHCERISIQIADLWGANSSDSR